MNISPLRQSTIKDYCFCPKLFQYRHIDCIPPAFRNASAVHGTIVHTILSQLHTQNWDLDPRQAYLELLDYEEHHSDEAYIPVYWKGDRNAEVEKFTDEAVSIIDSYRSKDYNQKAKIILVEASFTVKLGRAGEFTGTIDQLREHDDGSYELIDFKTSEFPPDQAFLDCDYQFGIYAYALWKGRFQMPDDSTKILRIRPDKLTITWYHLRDHIPYKRATNGRSVGDEKGDPRRCTIRTVQQMASLKRDVSKIASNIHREVFPRNPSYATCAVCPFSSICVQDSIGKALNRNQQRQV
ncbi:PD-(D/E)XK nuclease family protein, partial [bacterium]|nr:PD-(D/E)XK nuclease family protein [bacterium]